ncbi:MAG: flagellar filament capping protein FliD [Deltaproteobacteria bacterium]|nr:flagellar filament capping protein FliD [Deltaproteobacteria bacterium]
MATSTVSGLASGINWTDIISQLMEIERRPITLLESRKSDYQEKLSAWQTINTRLLSLKSEADSLKTASDFLAKTASSSDEDILTVSATSSAVAGSYSVTVNRLAQSHKIGSQGWEDEDSTAVASSSGTFTFSVGSGDSVEISVDSTTTLLDLRDAINGADGGLTATILNDGSATNPYRLVLTADESGEENAITISNNDTSLNFSTKSIETAAADSDNTFDGTVTSSGTYTGTENKTYLIEITTGGALGAAKFKVSEDGGVTWGAADAYTTSATATSIFDELHSTDQGVDVAFGAGTQDFAVGDRFTIDVFNPTLQAAQDASLEVDNISMTKSSNTITDVIEGMTLNLLSADSSSPVSVTVSNDTSTVMSNISDFVEAYNSALSLIDEQFQYDSDNDTSGPLNGDATLRNIQQQLRSIISTSIDGLTGDYVVLSQIGIKTGSDGQLAIDESDLSDALSDDFVGVSRIFVGHGSTSHGSVSYLSHTDDTEAGTYDIRISGNTLQFRVSGGDTWYDAPEAVDSSDVFTGPEDSPMEGLRIQTAASTPGDYGTVTITRGVAAQLSRQLDYLTDSYTGTIHYQEKGIEDHMDYLDDRIADLEVRMDQIEARYTRQFSVLEALLGRMQSQSDWLTNQVVRLR